MSRSDRQEDHSLHHELEDVDGLKPQELAAMRWKAIEAFNGVLGISAMARRLGVKLIACMDAKTRQCYPGEARIAAELGVHISAVKKAKAELKDAGLINWSNPGGPRHLSHYTFDWAALMKHWGLAKQRGVNAVSKNIAKRRQGTPQGTMGHQFNSTPQGTNEANLADSRATVALQPSKVPKTESHSTQISSHSTPQGTPIVPAQVPDITQDIALKDITQHITPSQANGEMHFKKDESKNPCPYPRLFDAFGDTPETQELIMQLSSNEQFEASKALTMKGKDAALAIILKYSTIGNE